MKDFVRVIALPNCHKAVIQVSDPSISAVFGRFEEYEGVGQSALDAVCMAFQKRANGISKTTKLVLDHMGDFDEDFRNMSADELIETAKAYSKRPSLVRAILEDAGVIPPIPDEEEADRFAWVDAHEDDWKPAHHARYGRVYAELPF
jgi:hypothetical protein